MGGCLKALLAVGAILVILAVVAGVGGYYWYSKHGRQLADSARMAATEGAEFGEETDDRGCLDEALARHRRDPGFASGIAQKLFLKGCLSSSEPSDGFCGGVPKRKEIIAGATWQAKTCAGAGFSDPYCRQVVSQVQQYCESDLAPKHARP